MLWLVEHIAREMDVACAVRCLAQERYGLDITVRNMFLHTDEVTSDYLPEVVVHPFFYFVSGALATEDYVKTWPDAVHFNLAWEELHYGAHAKIKGPADEFTRKHVLHHAWGGFYRDYLLSHGVPPENIFVNGQPAYQLYRSPYSTYYKDRQRLADEYGLDPGATWVFLPENYRWAFIDHKFEFLTKAGGDPQEMMRLQEFCRDSLRQVLRWCNDAAAQDGLVIIFRPRPSIHSGLIAEFFHANVGCQARNLHFLKGESVREWVLASNIVLSSYSTTLIEAAVAGKPAYMVEPVPIPASLYCEWYEHIPRIRTADQFKSACGNRDASAAAAGLKAWAEREMLSRGDPIEGLVGYVRQLLAGRERASGVSRVGEWARRVKAAWRQTMLAHSRKRKGKRYFNPATHENDVFSSEDVERKTAAWRKVLSEQTGPPVGDSRR